jgi:LDH2 family malate/lactate/ureidoglycolate dehydrogenase
MADKETEAAIVDADALRDFAIRAFEAVDVPRKDAEITADSMVESSLRGEGDHGARLIYIWCHKIIDGGTDPLTPIEVVRDHAATALLDAHNGIGAVAASRAMNMAIEKAHEFGVGWVGVRNSNSLGSARFYALMPLPHKMVGICLTNGWPLMVPPGGLEARTGTNPISIAAPAKNGFPVVLDMACTQSAYERIRVYADQGKKIPPGWAINSEGNLVEDPREISQDAFRSGGGLIGIGHGGYKGFGLSVMVNILTGVLNGGAYFEGLSEFAPYNVSERVSFVLTAVNIEQFVPFDDFVEQMENFAQIMKSCKLSLGTTEVYLPGEQGFRRLEERHRSGLPLDRTTAKGLRDLTEKLKIPGVSGL